MAQGPISSHHSIILLVAAYENHSCKRPAPVVNTFSASRGCPLTVASTVLSDEVAQRELSGPWLMLSAETNKADNTNRGLDHSRYCAKSNPINIINNNYYYNKIIHNFKLNFAAF